MNKDHEGREVQRDRPSRLIADWMDGRLSEEDSLALQELLSGSTEARDAFLRHAELEATLREVADGSVIANSLPDMESLRWVSSARQANVQPAPQLHRLKREGPQREGRWRAILPRWAWLPALAAVVLFALISPVILQTQDPVADPVGLAGAQSAPPAPVATLTAGEGFLPDNRAAAIGDTLYEHTTLETRGEKAHVSMGYGAEVYLDGPSKLTFLSRDRLRLDSGAVTVNVAAWAKGFTVVTDSMEVVDLGTSFSVSAEGVASHKATVHDGVVRVRAASAAGRGADSLGLLVAEGQTLSVASGGMLTATMPKQSVHRHTPPMHDEPYYRPVTLHNTGVGLCEGDEDSHWRVVAGPDAGFNGPQYAIVIRPHARYLPNSVNESQWVSMRNWRDAPAEATYTFETQFVLDGYDLSTIRLFGRFLADNGVRAVRVNGRDVKVESWADEEIRQRFADRQFRFVDISEGLEEGTNVIAIDVWNGGQFKKNRHENTPNFMALRVEWYAYGRHPGGAFAMQ